MAFTLDPTLAADTFFVQDLPLCRVLLMDNALFPWVILVPRRAGLVEMTDLTPADATQLWEEISHISRALQRHTNAYKMNIGALGNVVRQLHVHVIARQQEDAAWPAPVWGAARERYQPEAAETMRQGLVGAS